MIYKLKSRERNTTKITHSRHQKEGDILDELRAIVEDMEEGNIDKLKIEREA